MPLNRDGVPVAPLDEQSTYAMERAAATAPARPKSAPGEWRMRGRIGELWIGGKFVAQVAPIGNRYYYEIPVPGAPTLTGWSNGYYAAQRAVRKALREVKDG